MIRYHKSAFGLNLLFRLHGSAVYRATIPGFISVIFELLIREYVNDGLYPEPDSRDIDHPYAIGVLVATITFLMVFRTQQAYARYWEACGATHHMLSKWLDAVTHTGCYHMQCDHYKDIKPPSFFDYPDLNRAYLTRDRERNPAQLDAVRTSPLTDSIWLTHRMAKKSIEKPDSEKRVPKMSKSLPAKSQRRLSGRKAMGGDMPVVPTVLEGVSRLDGGLGDLHNDGKATFFDPKNPDKRDPAGFASCQGGHAPHLFLQELAHLASLLSAVALSTLRNDIEGAESPLDVFVPGSEWPDVDPDKGQNNFTRRQKLLNFLGFGRSPEERTRYNASRPLPVIGGVSDGEIRFLQMARGPSAKTQLCWNWVSEFIIREHLAGSTGKVGPPIISRIIQFLGDGMIYYNHAKKIMFIPFPFPHAQLSALYVLVTIPSVAFLMDQYTEQVWLGSALTFLTVTALAGIHEVARELENPFRNVPNEIPVVTLQAQFNESLITMFAGYHPDHFWRDSAENIRDSLTENDTDSEKDMVPDTPTSAVSTAMQNENDTDSEKDMVPVSAAMQNEAATAVDTDARIQSLIQKIEEQGREIEKLRTVVGDAASLGGED